MADAKAIYRDGFKQFVAGEVDEAIRLYQKAITEDPELAIAWNALSMAFAKAERLEEAIEAGRKLIALEPEDPLSHTNLSRLLMQKGLIPEAEDARAEAMRLEMAKNG